MGSSDRSNTANVLIIHSASRAILRKRHGAQIAHIIELVKVPISRSRIIPFGTHNAKTSTESPSRAVPLLAFKTETSTMKFFLSLFMALLMATEAANVRTARLLQTVASDAPSLLSSDVPSALQSDVPSALQSDAPSALQSDVPSALESDVPSILPSDAPSALPSDVPSSLPSDVPISLSSDSPSDVPSFAR